MDAKWDFQALRQILPDMKVRGQLDGRQHGRECSSDLRTPGDGTWIVLVASDLANLLGTIGHGAKVPRVAGARVLWRDGLPIATSIAGELAWLVPLDAAETQAAQRALTLGPRPDQTVSVNV